MNAPEPNPELPDQDELVAYLDGELDEITSRQVESAMAAHPQVQRRVQDLQQTWDMLDLLPGAEVTPDFAQSTVATIALVAEQDAARRKTGERWRRLAPRAWWGLALLASGTIGYVLAGALWPDRNTRLLVDLPVIQRMEPYRQIDDIDFLRRLLESGAFDEEGQDD